MLLLTSCCITDRNPIFHYIPLMDAFKAACWEDLFALNEHSPNLNCVVCPIPFCARAGPHIGTMHEWLRRATSLCFKTAINDKQETLKMSHGEDEKATFVRCSRKQAFLVVPHIKLPLTQMQTHRYKQDLIRTGTRVDAFRICLLMWS